MQNSTFLGIDESTPIDASPLGVNQNDRIPFNDDDPKNRRRSTNLIEDLTESMNKKASLMVKKLLAKKGTKAGTKNGNAKKGANKTKSPRSSSVDLTEEEEHADKVNDLNILNHSTSTGKKPLFVKKKTVAQKKSAMFRAITMAKHTVDKAVDKDLLSIDDNTDDFLDESGKQIRW